jgi:hypothetical protein
MPLTRKSAAMPLDTCGNAANTKICGNAARYMQQCRANGFLDCGNHCYRHTAYAALPQTHCIFALRQPLLQTHCLCGFAANTLLMRLCHKHTAYADLQQTRVMATNEMCIYKYTYMYLYIYIYIYLYFVFHLLLKHDYFTHHLHTLSSPPDAQQLKTSSIFASLKNITKHKKMRCAICQQQTAFAPLAIVVDGSVLPRATYVLLILTIFCPQVTRRKFNINTF